jgi:hypothetical protein
MIRSTLIAAVGAAALATAGTAAAQVTTGTITITGTVSPKCSVTTGGAGGTFGATVNLGEIAGADGLLRPDLGSSAAATPATSSSFTLKCTGSNVGVSVTSTALDNLGAASAPAGYTETVNFIGRASIDLVGAAVTPLNVDDSSSAAGATTSSFGPGAFLANAADNVRVSAYGFNTAPSAILLAGSYSGQIVVVLTPS